MSRARTGRARYVAFEGIDGAGKSTVARRVAARLRREGHRVALRHEPASPELGRRAQEAGRSDPWISAVYFTLDRYLARPALERDLARHEIVLTDRSFWSTLAYQGSALRPDRRRLLRALQAEATVRPERVVLLDLPASAALERVGGRGSARGPLEEARTLERVARSYRAFARAEGWLRLDARAPLPQLVGAARGYVLAPAPPRARPARAHRR